MSDNGQPEPKSAFSRPAVWIGVTLLGIAAATASYLFVDPWVIEWVRSHPNTWHKNEWVNAFRQLGKAGVPIWLLLVWSCLTDRWRPTAVTLAALVLTSASVVPLKGIVRRYRPSAVVAASEQPSSRPEVEWEDRLSFPSGDTAVAFALATTLSSSLGWPGGPALFAAAGGVGLLRVTAMAHYPSDVMAGALLGVLCGGCALRWMPRRHVWRELRVKRPWRVVFLIGVLAAPLVSPLLGLTALRTFLRVFAIPLALLALMGWMTVRLRAQRGPATLSVPLGSPEPKSDPSGARRPDAT